MRSWKCTGRRRPVRCPTSRCGVAPRQGTLCIASELTQFAAYRSSISKSISSVLSPEARCNQLRRRILPIHLLRLPSLHEIKILGIAVAVLVPEIDAGLPPNLPATFGRRVLKWTYADGYYWPEHEHVKFFGFLQGEAESGLERPHQCAENEPQVYLNGKSGRSKMS
ncbi:hypothetical protein ACFXTN_038863 [Malus domestica]